MRLLRFADQSQNDAYLVANLESNAYANDLLRERSWDTWQKVFENGDNQKI